VKKEEEKGEGAAWVLATAGGLGEAGAPEGAACNWSPGKEGGGGLGLCYVVIIDGCCYDGEGSGGC